MADISEVKGIDVNEVIDQVKQAIIESEKRQADDPIKLEIESLTLTLKTLIGKDVGGNFKITIPFINLQLGGGASVKKEETQTIVMTLKPPTSTEGPGFLAKRASFKTNLIDAIVIIRDGVKAASLGEPKFDLDNATVELNFVVGMSGEIEVIVKGSENLETTNALELKLRKKVTDPS